MYERKYILRMCSACIFSNMRKLLCYMRNISHIFFSFFYRKSEFLGCLMIPVKMAMRKNINGSFLLQPQMSLNNPSPLIPEAEKKMLNATLDDDMKENHCYQNIN